jgi:hypothetical protein
MQERQPESHIFCKFYVLKLFGNPTTEKCKHLGIYRNAEFLLVYNIPTLSMLLFGILTSRKIKRKLGKNGPFFTKKGDSPGIGTPALGKIRICYATPPCSVRIKFFKIDKYIRSIRVAIRLVYDTSGQM